MKQLYSMVGKTHHQHSAVCVMHGKEILWETCEKADLTVREMTEPQVKQYVQYDQPLHSCGSYKFESMGRHLFSEVKGDQDVIKGLPLTSLLLTLHRLNIISIG